jgi:hypothetical protein
MHRFRAQTRADWVDTYCENQYYPNPTLCIWATGSAEHITGRRFLILESAAFSETVFGSVKRQYRRPEESKTWNHC